MTGRKNLSTLIRNLKPTLHKGQFVFIECAFDSEIPLNDIIALFREEKGITLIMDRGKADKTGQKYEFVAAWITLMVHSSLEAVGLTARVSQALAKEGISCNAVAAYHHDHIFVPYLDAQRALAILTKISQEV
jgi:hypothetical protein